MQQAIIRVVDKFRRACRFRRHRSHFLGNQSGGRDDDCRDSARQSVCSTTSTWKLGTKDGIWSLLLGNCPAARRTRKLLQALSRPRAPERQSSGGWSSETLHERHASVQGIALFHVARRREPNKEMGSLKKQGKIKTREVPGLARLWVPAPGIDDGPTLPAPVRLHHPGLTVSPTPISRLTLELIGVMLG